MDFDEIKSKIPKLASLTIEELKEIITVGNFDKSRLSLKYNDVPNKYYIMANQGHSKESGDFINHVNLQPIEKPIPNVFHGSYKILYEPIRTNGLNRMGRMHIHIAKSIDAKSGMRKTCDMLVYIDMALAMADGIKFYESRNGVILTEGKDGVLEPKYLSFKFI